MYNFATSPRKSKSGSHSYSTSFLARPRMGALKNLYTSNKFPKLMYNSSGSEKKRKIKKSSPGKMEFVRKKPDYADTAYREAVGRLRILLAETYTPIGKRPIRELDSAGEETDNQSVISAFSRSSRYPHYHTFHNRRSYYMPRIVPRDDKLQKFEHSPEFSSFLERQEDYIDQLERESKFCREELSNLLSKVKEVISENEYLHEKQKTNLMKSVFDQFETETETDNEIIKTRSTIAPKRNVSNLEAPSIVYQSRISELEAQLTQAKIDLKKAQEHTADRRDLCEDFDHKHKIESLQKENSTLQDTVTKLQSALNLLKDKEHSTTDQVKRSLDVAEQAQYEKSAAEHEIRRLKDELERQHAKVREAIAEQSRRVAEERAAVERRYSQQIEQLTGELGIHWEQSSKFQLELDKQRRECSDLRRELAQKQALIDELKKEMQNKIITLQSDIGVSGAEKSALEQQISTLQMANERFERQNKQEAARLQVEMQSLRQRLDRADGDLIHSRRENVRLTEQIAALEKEMNLNAALAEEKKRSEAIALPAPEPDMNTKILEIESKHAATVAELEGMIQSQNQLMDKLSAECHALTQKLDESSTRHKEEIRELQTNLGQLTSKFSQSQLLTHTNPDERTEQAAPKVNLSRTGSISSTPQQEVVSQDQAYYNTEQYSDNQQYDPNYQTEGYDYSDGQYVDQQQYDPNQQYMTQEQYDQEYQQQQYPTEQQPEYSQDTSYNVEKPETEQVSDVQQ